MQVLSSSRHSKARRVGTAASAVQPSEARRKAAMLSELRSRQLAGPNAIFPQWILREG